MNGSTQSEISKNLKNEKINRLFIYRTIKRYNDTKSVEDKPRSGRPATVRTRALREKLRSKIRRNPRRSIRKMAREYPVNRETLRKMIHEDLGLKSLKRQTVHHLTPTLRIKRLERCKKLLRRLINEDSVQILFSDEKIFTVDEATNRQNDRMIVSPCKDIPESIKFIDRVQRPLSVMVWAGVSADSRTKLIFVPQGVKINSQTYKESLFLSL
ncbi:MhmaT1 transposase [Oopsacas minuta]|uniref:MhmaT1 transposase n=1 Tax=Oopsacas minuta TaxID=111878 RepID=A0AAV7JCM7_9METZ|nr:MhmaT1 transposase [Oopsacas minuta]